MSRLADFIESQIKNHSDSRSVDAILNYLNSDIIPNIGNNFDELITIAKVAKPWRALCYYYKPFVESLKAKIIEQRGEIDGQILINKFN